MAYRVAIASTLAGLGLISQSIVKAPTTGYYYLFAYTSNGVFKYYKSTDSGYTWSEGVTIDTPVDRIAIWADWQTNGDTGTFIHIICSQNTTDDLRYFALDTSTDTLGSALQGFNGASGTGSAVVFITKTRGGTVRGGGTIDGGTEVGHFSVVSPYTSITTGKATTWNEGVVFDTFAALPGNYADNEDFDLWFDDESANEITCKTYDASANTWSESAARFSSILEQFNIASFMSVAHAKATSKGYIAAWNDYDTATADLVCGTWDGTTFTAGSNIVTNSDDCNCVALMYDNNASRIYAFYRGKSDGSETATTSWKVYYKYSDDDMATWSAEQTLFDTLVSGGVLSCPSSIPTFDSAPPVVFTTGGAEKLVITIPDVVADTDRAAHLINGGVVRAA